MHNIPLHVLRLSTAEILACAVKDLFPDVSLVEGGTTSWGFFYDFSFKKAPEASILLQIEERMRQLVTQDLPIRSLTMMRANAMELFKHHKQFLKIILLSKEVDPLLDVFQLNDFYDVCPAPHLTSTKEAAAFRLLGMESVPLELEEKAIATRIEGIVFPDKKMLKEGVKNAEAAKKRNHLLIGKKKRLFLASDQVGKGCLIWLPKGNLYREKIINWWRRQIEGEGYQILSSPKLVELALLQKAYGRQNWNERNLTLEPIELDGIAYSLVPGQAPLHAFLFKDQQFKPSELPIRYAECSEVFDAVSSRYLSGLQRTRNYTRDCAHCFCTPDQVIKELISSLLFIEKITKMLPLKPTWCFSFSTRFKKSSPEREKLALKWFEEALKASGLAYRKDAIDQRLEGPKVTAYLEDSFGREWEGPSVAIDLHLPSRLGLHVESKGSLEGELPVMLVTVLFGSLERFMALLIEHYEGEIPLWLTQEQHESCKDRRS